MDARSTARFSVILRSGTVGIGLCIVLASCLGQAGSATGSVGNAATSSPSVSPSASGLTLPDIPAGFPLMPGMQPDDSHDGDAGHIARWTTKANGAEVYSFLESALPDAGYHVDVLAPGDAGAVIRFTPPGGGQLQIELGQVGSGTFDGTVMELRLPRD